MEGQGEAQSRRLRREGERASWAWTCDTLGQRASSSSCGLAGVGGRTWMLGGHRKRIQRTVIESWSLDRGLGFGVQSGRWGDRLGKMGPWSGACPLGPSHPALHFRWPSPAVLSRGPCSGRGESSNTCPGRWPGSVASSPVPLWKLGSPACLGLPATFLLGNPSFPGGLGTGSPGADPSSSWPRDSGTKGVQPLSQHQGPPRSRGWGSSLLVTRGVGLGGDADPVPGQSWSPKS